MQTLKLDTRSEMISLMSKSTNKIRVAVSWLTDELLINKLTELTQKVKVEVLLSCDVLNVFRYSEIRKLQKAGATVLKRGASAPGKPGFMHAKMIIIDDSQVYGGSYNFTGNANENDENFDQYLPDRVSYWGDKFNDWFRDAKDYTIDFENPEELKKIVQSQFAAEEEFRKSFFDKALSSQRNYVEKEITEREAILREEVRKEELRKTATEMQIGNKKVSPTGQLSADNGITSKPHRFYGGRLLTKFHGQKERNSHASALWHKKDLEAKFPFLKCRIKNDTLICSGDVQPTGCSKYRIRIEFRAGTFPQVYILDPHLKLNPDIHIYKEGSLCLFYPGDLNWKNTTSIAEYTIPWIFEWVIYYELFQMTGKWEGDFVPHGSNQISNQIHSLRNAA